jgi:precorrin-8X/cobalt-precorrin-8 methylmutase
MITDPLEIEKKSFEIITKELGDFEIEEDYRDIIKRVIHATADFEYAKIIEFHPQALKSGIAALKNGCKIYVDTRMTYSGINKRVLKEFSSKVYTFIDDKFVIEDARARGITRSIVGIEKACEDLNTKIFVIGNAPTALIKLKELIEEKKIKPNLVIGVPVGFVGAAESKEDIKKTDIPYIVTRGRKGGSTVAVSIVNAILYRMIKSKG